MIVGAAAQRPVEFAFHLHDGQLVDACMAHTSNPARRTPSFRCRKHGTNCQNRRVLVGKAHSYATFVEGPNLLDEAIVNLAPPFAREQSHYLLRTDGEFRAIAPAGISRVRERDPLRVSRIPAIFRETDLLHRGLFRERREGRSWVQCGSPSS